MRNKAESGHDNPEQEKEPEPFDSGACFEIKESALVCEDAFINDQEAGLFGVADGVGGSHRGDLASHLATSVLGRSFTQNQTGSARERLREAAKESAKALENDPAVRGSTTTLSAVAIERTGDTFELHIAHIGDSRVYCFRKESQTLERLTRDDGYLELLIKANILSRETADAIDQSTQRGADVDMTEEETEKINKLFSREQLELNTLSGSDRIAFSSIQPIAERIINNIKDTHRYTPTSEEILYAMRNFLTKCLGNRKRDPTITTAQARKGDVLIIVSDGVSDPLTDQQITNIIIKPTIRKKDSQDIADSLIMEADAQTNKRKKNDDRCAVVVKF